MLTSLSQAHQTRKIKLNEAQAQSSSEEFSDFDIEEVSIDSVQAEEQKFVSHKKSPKCMKNISSSKGINTK